MSVSIVARRYARALVELGLEENRLDAIVSEVTAVAEAWEASPDFRNAIENPLVAHAAKKAVIAQLAARLGMSPTTRNTLQIMVDRRRMAVLPSLARALRELADARKGVVRAEVTSAVPLPEEYYSRLQAKLEKMSGKRIAIDRRTDPAILGGVVARLGDRVFDGSLRTRLHSIRDALLPN